MCGIAGFVTLEPGPEPAAVLERMCRVIEHRGPDGAGTWSDGTAWLGHRRLSIIDLAAGQQPMANEDETAWVTYNGEIFNHADLRPALERAGHRYRTHCDTEAILHAYEQYGEECVARFRGMFSFALWDRTRRELFCARDRFGKKPFYYFWDGRLFAFASEIKALLEHPAISARLEESVLAEYLAFGYGSSDRTLFKGIRKLMPGHTLKLRLAGPDAAPEIRRYWEIPIPGKVERRAEREWVAECRERLEEAVRTRLMSDVPLGMFLSGGVDSSAIAALIKKLAPGPVETFSVGYGEEQFSELSYARQVANTIGTDHHEVVVSMDQFFDALPKLVWHEDEPITWPSSVSLYFVAKLASERVKVVLTGEGSDELFGGYARYRAYMINHRWAARYGVLPGFVRDAVRRAIRSSRLLSADVRRKAEHTFFGREASLESLYLDNFYCGFPAADLERLLAREADPYASFHRYWAERNGSTLLQRMLYADQKTYLVELLMKQDQMSMAASIESRVPFLDHHFAEFAWRVPDDLKVRGATGKYILKRAVEDLLPRDIIYRKKMGFPTPIRHWLRSAAAAPLLARLEAKDGLIAEYLDLAEVRALLDRQRAGVEDATDRIWILLNLQIWGDLFLNGRRPADTR
ncbi:MAG: asparagine synthase (glutamine-hydrolyzing) [bacterium]|jgi:asparagine synthase (glutamine-hydrolysing)